MRLVDPALHVDEFLALENLASAPYMHFVYETPEAAREIARFLWESGAGEFIAPYGALALDDSGTPLAMFAILDQSQLASARTSAAMAVVRGKRIDPRSRTRERMRLANDTLLVVEPDELYLSRIAVSPAARGRGIALWLLQEFERAARERGKLRLVLEVSPMHPEAIRLYERFGFSTREERRVHDPVSDRELIYRHMIKHVDPC